MLSIGIDIIVNDGDVVASKEGKIGSIHGCVPGQGDIGTVPGEEIPTRMHVFFYFDILYGTIPEDAIPEYHM